MGVIRFVHAADLHLDSPLKGLERYEGAPVERLRGATRRALEGLVDLAVGEGVEFVVIAGDLYDGDWRDFNTGLFLNKQMARLAAAGIAVYIIKGNHDAESKMTKSLRLPENVHVFAHGKPETKLLEGLGVALHGQSYKHAAVRDDLSASYPAAVPGYLNIGILHTGLTGMEGHEPYAPCTLEGLKRKGYDYWALGHVHKRFDACEDPWVVFPGNVQGRHIRETGEKGVYVVEAQGGRITGRTFRRLDRVRWELCRVDAGGIQSVDELIEAWTGQLRSLLDGQAGDDLMALRVQVQGACPIHERLQADSARYVNELRSEAIRLGGERVWLERVEFLTRAEGPPAVSEGPIGEIMRCLAELLSDDAALAGLDKEFDEIRKKLPSEWNNEADGPRFGEAAWLREVLSEAQPVLMSRLLEPVLGSDEP